MIWMPMLYFVGNVMWEPILTATASTTNLAGLPLRVACKASTT